MSEHLELDRPITTEFDAWFFTLFGMRGASAIASKNPGFATACARYVARELNHIHNVSERLARNVANETCAICYETLCKRFIILAC